MSGQFNVGAQSRCQVSRECKHASSLVLQTAASLHIAYVGPSAHQTLLHIRTTLTKQPHVTIFTKQPSQWVGDGDGCCKTQDGYPGCGIPVTAMHAARGETKQATHALSETRVLVTLCVPLLVVCACTQHPAASKHICVLTSAAACLGVCMLSPGRA
jgi:hypothetical protein